MRTSLLCLPMLALAMPLGAQEINAPEPRWPVATAMADSSSAGTALEPGQASAEQTTAETQDSSPLAEPGAVSAPIAQPSTSGEAKPSQRRHGLLRACAPNFSIVNPGEDDSPLTVHQKFRIFYRYSYDPCRIAAAAVSAGISQAEDSFHEYGQGAQGYGKRFGAGLADANVATFFGRFLLPSLLHDDPRYFRIGPSGTFKQRLVHAMLSPEWTRRDNGTHRFNYSRVLGDLMASSVGNAYYPEEDRTAGHTFGRAATMLATASGSGAFEEFWPDIKAKLFKKHKQEPSTK